MLGLSPCPQRFPPIRTDERADQPSTETPVRSVFFGTSSFAVPTLRTLALRKSPPVAVYTQPDQPAGRGRRLRSSPVKDAAQELGIDIIQPPSLRPPEEMERLRAFEPTVLILAAYGKILPQPVLRTAPRGGLNLHPSLLPRYRGPSPVATAILDGSETTGVSVFVMDAGMDSGPVVAQRDLPIAPDDTTRTLTERLAHEAADLLLEVLVPWVRQTLPAEPQDPALATTTKLLSRDQAMLDFLLPADALVRRVRAFDPWPGTVTTLDGQRLNIRVAHEEPQGAGDAEPGHVVERETGEIGVAAAGGSLLVLDRVQIAGRRPVTAQEFARGRQGFVGSVLPS